MLAETPVTQRSPCYSAVFSSLMSPLPDCSNYSPFHHTHYLILRIVSSDQILYQAALQHFTAQEKRSALRKLNNKQRQVLLFLLLLFKLSSQFPFVSFLSLSLSSLCSLYQSFLFSHSSSPLVSPPFFLSLLINSLSS